MTVNRNPNPRREKFCELVAQGCSNRAAAEQAGYSQHSAASIGSQLIASEPVQQRIRELRNEQRLAVETMRDFQRQLTAARS